MTKPKKPSPQRAAAKARAQELLSELDESFVSNDDVRAVETTLYTIASNLAVLVLSHKMKVAEPLGEILRVAAQTVNDKKARRRLRKLATISDELEAYADKSRYDGLEDSDIEAANELREALHDGLDEWINSVQV